MGCDIHTFAEVMMQGKWQKIEEDVFPEYADIKTSSPFNWRSYSMFAFLAGVRNYDHCVPISDPKGLPEDSEYLNSYIMPYKDKEYSPNSAIPMKTVLKNIYQNPYYHSLSYLTLEELLSFDYEKTFWNRRISRQLGPNSWTGAAKAEEGEGKIISYRENLGEDFFLVLDCLSKLGNPKDVRVIFYFDN